MQTPDDARFEELMQHPSRTRETEIIQHFLDLTHDAIGHIYQGKAVKLAETFETYRERAWREHGDLFYAQFFAALANILKRHHPP